MAKKNESDSGTPAPEFARGIDVAELKGQRRDISVAATAEEQAALAERFGVDGISNLVAQVTLTPFASGNKVAVKAKFSADIAQTCVVTLEPLTNRIEGDFFAEFVQRAFSEDGDEVEFGPDDDDPPEPIVEGQIEFGELIAQNLGLLIDPFPRKPGVVFEAVSIGEDAGEGGSTTPGVGRLSPFAVLESLKHKKN